jgi:hypothetical protein
MGKIAPSMLRPELRDALVLAVRSSAPSQDPERGFAAADFAKSWREST